MDSQDFVLPRGVRTGWLTATGHAPAIVAPEDGGPSLPQWIAAAREQIEKLLDAAGAVLFRGFPLLSAQDFAASAGALCPALCPDYGDLPVADRGSALYQATPYPRHLPIRFHNEASHTSSWPLRQMFFAQKPAAAGGEWRLADGRQVLRRLPPEIRRELATRGLRYVRNFIPGFDVPWQEFFRTEDRSKVEECCRRDAWEFEWKPGNGLRISRAAPAIVVHPRTGEEVWFNQIQLHHSAYLDPVVREALYQAFAPGDLPRTVLFGDGGPIETRLLEAIDAALEACAVDVATEQGDMLVVDNMLMAHARRPYEGDRRVIVAIGDMMSGSAGEGPAR